MKIKYPIGCDTPEKKTAFLYRLYELLRLDGNANGWNKIRNEKHDCIISEILTQRNLLKKDNTNNANIGDFE